jgi:putative membrane protein
MRLLLRILINAAALWAAVHFVSGIHFTGSTAGLFGVALVFGILNAIVLLLTSALSSRLGLGFFVDGFGAAFWGAIVVSVVSIVLSLFVRDSTEARD